MSQVFSSYSQKNMLDICIYRKNKTKRILQFTMIETQFNFFNLFSEMRQHNKNNLQAFFSGPQVSKIEVNYEVS